MLIVTAAVVGSALLVFLGAIIFQDSTAASVRFVNDTGIAVALPDCSTDLVSLDAGQGANVPIASDRPVQCTVDNLYKGTIIGCVTMPHTTNARTVIRLSHTHPCR